MRVVRGEVVRVDWPYSDGTGSKIRPAIVVQIDLLNSRIADTILVLASRTRRAIGFTGVLIDPATEPQSGLRFPSAVSCNNLLTIDQSRIIQVIGSLSPAAMKQIEASIKAALGLP
jgi:mRNA interferase MazF